MRLNLVAEARHWWRLFSIQMMGLSVAIQGTWSAFGDDLKTYIPHAVISAISMGLLFLGIGGRLVAQPAVTNAVNEANSPGQNAPAVSVVVGQPGPGASH